MESKILNMLTDDELEYLFCEAIDIIDLETISAVRRVCLRFYDHCPEVWRTMMRHSGRSMMRVCDALNLDLFDKTADDTEFIFWKRKMGKKNFEYLMGFSMIQGGNFHFIGEKVLMDMSLAEPSSLVNFVTNPDTPFSFIESFTSFLTSERNNEMRAQREVNISAIYMACAGLVRKEEGVEWMNTPDAEERQTNMISLLKYLLAKVKTILDFNLPNRNCFPMLASVAAVRESSVVIELLTDFFLSFFRIGELYMWLEESCIIDEFLSEKPMKYAQFNSLKLILSPLYIGHSYIMHHRYRGKLLECDNFMVDYFSHTGWEGKYTYPFLTFGNDDEDANTYFLAFHSHKKNLVRLFEETLPASKVDDKIALLSPILFQRRLDMLVAKKISNFPDTMFTSSLKRKRHISRESIEEVIIDKMLPNRIDFYEMNVHAEMTNTVTAFGRSMNEIPLAIAKRYSWNCLVRSFSTVARLADRDIFDKVFDAAQASLERDATANHPYPTRTSSEVILKSCIRDVLLKNVFIHYIPSPASDEYIREEKRRSEFAIYVIQRAQVWNEVVLRKAARYGYNTFVTWAVKEKGVNLSPDSSFAVAHSPRCFEAFSYLLGTGTFSPGYYRPLIHNLLNTAGEHDFERAAFFAQEGRFEPTLTHAMRDPSTKLINMPRLVRLFPELLDSMLSNHWKSELW